MASPDCSSTPRLLAGLSLQQSALTSWPQWPGRLGLGSITALATSAVAMVFALAATLYGHTTSVLIPTAATWSAVGTDLGEAWGCLWRSEGADRSSSRIRPRDRDRRVAHRSSRRPGSLPCENCCRSPGACYHAVRLHSHARAAKRARRSYRPVSCWPRRVPRLHPHCFPAERFGADRFDPISSAEGAACPRRLSCRRSDRSRPRVRSTPSWGRPRSRVRLEGSRWWIRRIQSHAVSAR